MIASGEVDALWILTPNHTRLDTMREIHRVVRSGTARAARRGLRKAAGPHRRGGTRDAAAGRGFRAAARLSREPAVLDRRAARQEDHLAPRRAVGRPALSRRGPPRSMAARTSHGSGEGDKQGGGVLSDMMYHSVEVARFLADGARRGARQPAPSQRQRHGCQPGNGLSRATPRS